MQFDVLFYETEAGNCPVLDFLEALRREDVRVHQRLVKQLEKVGDSEYHREPFSKHIGDGLFEVRVLGDQAARAVYCFGRERRIIVLHAFRKKSRKLPVHERAVALGRMQDYVRRFGDG